MKHVDQAFPQLLGSSGVKGTAQPDDTATARRGCQHVAEGGAGAGYDDPRPAAGWRGG